MIQCSTSWNSIRLQDRDMMFFRGLFESRIMTSAHVQNLYFLGSKEAAKKRLQRLKTTGFITERPRAVSAPAVLFLTGKSLSLLKDRGILAEYPPLSLSTLRKRARVSEMTVRHELEVMDVKASFYSAIREHEKVSVVTFSTWPLLCQFEVWRGGGSGQKRLVKPDGFLRIRIDDARGGISEHPFFLEVDRSTESLKTLISRSAGYLDHYKSGGFALRSGFRRSEFKDHPFRVLIVLQNAKRRNNLAQRLLQSTPPILTLVYLTTAKEVKADPLGEIWIRPLDYREAITGLLT